MKIERNEAMRRFALALQIHGGRNRKVSIVFDLEPKLELRTEEMRHAEGLKGSKTLRIIEHIVETAESFRKSIQARC